MGRLFSLQPSNYGIHKVVPANIKFTLAIALAAAMAGTVEP